MWEKWRRCGLYLIRYVLTPDKHYRDISLLIHWGQATHIYVSKLSIISSDNRLSPGRVKPLSEPMLEYCKLDSLEQTSITC